MDISKVHVIISLGENFWVMNVSLVIYIIDKSVH